MLAKFNIPHFKSLNMDDLLVSIMLRYPEIGTIRYNPRHRLMKFTFIVMEQLDERNLCRFSDELKKALSVYNQIERRRPALINSDFAVEGGITLVSVVRDLGTLKPDEISFVVDFFKDWFETESWEDMLDEELLFQEQMIRQSLEQFKHLKNSRGVIALREDGRVVIYNN